MGIKWHCDLCKKFIIDSDTKGFDTPKVNKPFVITYYYERKNIEDEYFGWSGSKDEVGFWACEDCTEKFMERVHMVAKEMGLGGGIL